MKNLLSLIFVFLIFISFTLAQTASVNDGCAPLTVNFTAPSGTASFFWNFKDGASSNLRTPSNTFIAPGTYIVEFKNSQTGPIVGTQTIIVSPKPVPYFTVNNNQGCAPQTISFIDSTILSPSVSVNSYSWVFEDGGTASGSSISHSFNTSGNFFVSLQLNTSSPSCNVTKQYNNFISLSNPPNISFTTNPNPAVSCTAPLTVNYTNTSTSPTGPLTYTWDLGNNQTSTAINPQSQTYSNEQIYLVKLIGNDTNMCADSSFKSISIGSPIADFIAPDTICKNLTDTIFNLSTGNPIWDFGPNVNVITYFQGIHPVISYSTGGLKNIMLRLSAGTCKTDTVIRIFIDSIKADYTSTIDRICQYPATVNFNANILNANSYKWIFGDGSTSTLSNPMTTYVSRDSNVYSKNKKELFITSFYATTNFGCVDSIERKDSVHAPNALMMPNVTEGCAPLNVTFSDSSSLNPLETLVKWEYFFGDGTSITKTDSSRTSHSYTMTGLFNAYLVVTNHLGCTDTSYNTLISVGEQITPDFMSDQLVVCIGDTVRFTEQVNSPIKDSIDVWNYSSESGRFFNCFQDKDASWVYTNEVGPQDVTLTVGFNGCLTSITKPGLITVNGAVAKIDYLKDCTIPLDLQVRDSSLNSNGSVWQLGDGTQSALNDFTHSYTTTGDYLLTLKAEDIGSGCSATFDSTTIFIRNIQATINIDSVLCKDVSINLDARNSVDAYEFCHRGYRWLFSDSLMRPITTDNSLDSTIFKLTQKTTVSLIATDINGCLDTATKIVKVFGIEAAFIFSDDTICAPGSINFTDQSTSDTTIAGWKWSYDVNESSLLQNPSHTFNTFIPQDITTLIVSDVLGCADTLKKTLQMYEPNSNVTISDANICAGTSVDFTATDFTTFGSNLTYNWNFDNGITSNQQNPTVNFLNEGIYTVSLNFTETSTGCSNDLTRIIDVRDYPIAGFFSDSDTSKYICPNTNIIFQDTTVSNTTFLNYQWDFGNGRISSFKNPGTFYVNNGSYTIKQIAIVPSPFNCSDTTYKTIFVKGPEGNFTTDIGTDTICRSETVLFTLKDTSDLELYTWDFGDGTSAQNMSPISHQYNFVPNSGQTTAKLILSNTDGSCAVTRTAPINIYEVKADFLRNNGLDTGICFGPYPILNESKNSDSYVWDFGDGKISTYRDVDNINYFSPGIYNVQLSVKNSVLGCTDTIIKKVIIYENPVVNLINDTICEGNTGFVRIPNGNSNYTYAWSTFPLANFTIISPTLLSSSPTKSTLFIADVIDTNGCTAVDSATIFVINPLNLSDFDTTIVIGDKIELPVYGNGSLYNIRWTPEIGLSCLDCLPPTVQPLEKVEYNLLLEDKLGCFNYDVNFTVDIYPETFIKMPTTFSPNNDGVNDEIKVLGWGIKELLEYQIFNRFGEIVFETSDINKGWNGVYKGKIQSADVYVYKIKVSTWTNEEKALEGYINLVR